ncbi:DUF3993 domain-containing protein [Mangrovibacillus cuniculi]|uniref:DUF3993 domain-containing protein n=1 Tax=Mangrovibacillus cuniculi TaxID=2593652 RepID=A0A7S8HF88_9BACI|nr:DUF3993 domain-containing protein [Mangrovibacillus cuniculi]QPC46175.1 DUF3993 domain-containing protein [Mangrovibacillus cuniculi]
MHTIFAAVHLYTSLIGVSLEESKEVACNRSQLEQKVDDAFYAQVSLNQGKKTLEEVYNTLDIHFTREESDVFLHNNIVETVEGWFTKGTDFAPGYVPYFRFDSSTEVIETEDYCILYEPVTNDDLITQQFQGQHVGVWLTNDQYNKISKMSSTLTEEDIQDLLLEKINGTHKQSYRSTLKDYLLTISF